MRSPWVNVFNTASIQIYLHQDPVVPSLRKVTLHVPPFKEPLEVLGDELEGVHGHATQLPWLPFPQKLELNQDI